MIAFIREKNTEPRIQKIEEPQIQGPDQVKIKILYSTLCRDDMHVSDDLNLFGYGIIGHEAVGIIVNAGKNALSHGFCIGNLVSLLPFSFCGSCKNCRMQKPQNCTEIQLLSGVLCEFVVRDYKTLVPVPDGMSLRQASIIEPVADVLSALEKISVDFTSEILIVGAGFLGLVTIQILYMLGVKKIVVTEPLSERRELALKYGADEVFDSSLSNLQLELLKSTDFQGFNVVIDTSARTDILDFALPCICHGGTFLLMAYNDILAKIKLPIIQMYSYNIHLIWSALCDVKSILSAKHLIQRLKLDRLITAEYPFSNVYQAYHTYLGTDEIKIGIHFP